VDLAKVLVYAMAKVLAIKRSIIKVKERDLG
jgi:hypothetical protein